MAGPIRIAVLANASQAQRSLTETASAAERLSGRMSRLRLPATLALGAVAAGAKKAVDAASDLNEEISKSQQVFGRQAENIEKFAGSAATSLGQSKQSALQATSTFGLIAQKAGLAGGESAKFAKKFTGLASDLASFNNTTPEEAIQAIGAAMRGESEPIRRYGVSLDEATLKATALSLGLVQATKDADGIRAAQLRAQAAQTRYNDAVAEYGKSSSQAKSAEASLIGARASLKRATEGTIPPLTAQQKALAASQAIMEQTTKAQGDFARTSDGAANKARILAAQNADLAAQLGQQLLPAYQRVLQIASQFVGMMAEHPTATRAAIITIVALAAGVLAMSAASAVAGAALTAYNGVTLVFAAVQRAATAASLGTRLGLAALAVQTAITSAVTKAAAVAQWALNAALLANPITLVVLAIVALVAAFVIAYKKSDTFRAIVDKTFSAIKTAVTTAVSFVVNFVKTKWPLLLVILTGPIGLAVALIVKNWARIKAATSAAWNGVKAVISTVINAVRAVVSAQVNAVRAVVTAVWNGIKAATSAVWNGIRTIVSTQVRLMLAIVTGIRSRVTGVFSSAGSWLLDAGRRIIQGLLDGIGSMIDSVKSKLGELTSMIPDWKGPRDRDARLLRPAGRLIMTGLIRGFNDSFDKVKSALGKVTDLIEKRFDKNKQRARAVIRSLRDEYEAVERIGKAHEKVANRLEKAKERLKEARDEARKYAADLKGAVVSYGSVVGLGKNDTTGITTTAGLLSDLANRAVAAQRFADLIKQLTASGLNKTSIEQLLDAGVEGGLATAEAIASGGAAAVSQINTLTSQIAATGKDLGQTGKDALHQAGIDTAQGLVDGLREKEQAVMKIAKRLARALADAVKKALGIHSPSRVFADIGRRTIDGLTIGLDQNTVRRSGQRLAGALEAGFGSPALVGATVGGGATVRLVLTAEQVSQIQRGREYVADIDAYRAAGGRVRAL